MKIRIGGSGCMAADVRAAAGGGVAAGAADAPTRKVDEATLLKPADGDWVSYGRDYAEAHHSPLTQINQSNVSRLGLAFAVEVGSDGKLETTPLVFNGVLYGTSTWSQVYAIDLRTNKVKWQWDPALVRGGFEGMGPRACCGPVNRGAALYDGKVYVGLLDGRLVALDAETGKPVWSVQTTPPNTDYTITGAPRIVKGKVVIGQGGAEYGVRGFLGAYDAQTGKLAWKFYVVPGDPKKGFEDPALAAAAKTWNGEWWKAGGGGTPWDGIAYDPELNLVYVGTGNGSPWNANHRSPGGGDNLYLASIVALECRYRQVRVALPDDAGRQLGLQRGAADDPGGPADRQPDAQGDHAGAEERLLLRARSHQRQADLRSAVRLHVVGHGDRHGDGPSARNRAGALSLSRRFASRRRRSARITGRRWRSTR